MNLLRSIFIASILPAACFASSLPPNLAQELKSQADELSPLSIQWTDNGQPQTLLRQNRCVYCGSPADAASFDGSTIYWRFENADQPVLLKIPASRLGDARRNVHWLQCRYLDAAGWHIPSTASQLAASNCQSVILQLIEAGASVSRLEYVQPTQIRIELAAVHPPAMKYVFYLDPKLGNAIRRQEEYLGGQLRTEIDNEDFQRLGTRSIWLPRHCRIETPQNPHDLRLISISLNPIPPDQFVLSTDRIGALISDETAPGGPINFQIPPAPATLDFDELTASAPPATSSIAPRIWILLAATGAALTWTAWRSRTLLTHRMR